MALVSVFVALAIGYVAVAMLLGGTSFHTMNPADLAPGDVYGTTNTPNGPQTYVRCPSPMSWAAGGRDERCSAEVRSVATFSAGSLAVAAAFALLAVWHWHRRRALLRQPGPSSRYQQDGMPATYWLATTVVGWFVATLLIAVVPTLIRPGATDLSRFGGPVFWAVIMWQIGRMYGVSAAYRLDLVDDRVLIWRSPTRRRCFLIDDLARVDLAPAGTVMLGELRASLLTKDGRTYHVVVPNSRHKRYLEALCATVGKLNPSFDWTAIRADTPEPSPPQ